MAVDSAGNAYVTGFTDSPDFPTTTSIRGFIRTSAEHTGQKFWLLSGGCFCSGIGSQRFQSGLFNLSRRLRHGLRHGDCRGCNRQCLRDRFYLFQQFPDGQRDPLSGENQTVFDHLACTNSFYFNANAFIAKIGPGGTNLVYSTYFGGTNFDEGKGIAVDTNGSVYVTGFTASTNFPTAQRGGSTTGLDERRGNQPDIHHQFLERLFAEWFDEQDLQPTMPLSPNSIPPARIWLIYSTFLGGTNNDVANGIAVDTNGAAYVTGWTISTNFPNTLGTSLPGFTHSWPPTPRSASWPRMFS